MKKCKNGCNLCDYNINNPRSICSSYANCMDGCPNWVHKPLLGAPNNMSCGCTLVGRGQECPHYTPAKYPITDEEDDDE